LLKFDSSGDLLWAKTWDSGGTNQPLRVVVGTDGNIYAVGLTNAFDGTQWDVLLLKYDASGTLLQSAIRRGDSDSFAMSAAAAPGAILLAGVAADNGGPWQEFPGTPGAGPTATTLQSVSGVSISLTPTNVVGTTSAPAGVEDTGGGGADAFVAQLTFDFLPPAISISTNPSTLWPPNGKSVPVTVSGTITDSGSGVNPGTLACNVVDEYGLVQPPCSLGPLGAGGAYSFRVSLVASRNGNDKNGRSYTISVSASDYAGNPASVSTTVIVPHDQGK
jgi:hypothetical protein